MMTLDNEISLFHNLPVIAALFDSNGRFLDVSNEWVNRLGYSREEMVGKSPEDIATPDNAETIRKEHLPAFRRTGQLDLAVVEFQRKDGTLIELLTRANAHFDDSNRYKYSVFVFVEMANRSRAERRYRDLYHSTPAMLHTIDAEGRIKDVSDWWLKKLGYEREHVVGRSILDFMSEASQESVLGDGLTNLINAGDSKNIPRQMVSRSGSVVEVLMSATTERDLQANILSVLVASKDVTVRNRNEAKLREAYGEIARLKDELENERDYLREEVSVLMNFGRIIGQSPALVSMLAGIEAVADTPASALIIGETGSGKELVAHAIHARSRRSDAPLVKVNCASIPAELFESEFFGHVKGAFTGAYRDRVGRFQLADGGTIFLDEVGEIPLPLQGKLLRVLQEKEFERVGEDVTRRVDVRVIAATNKDLSKEVEAGRFREDLYYRLSVFPINVPPLRKRGDDVIQLAVHFLSTICREFGRPVPQLTKAQADALLNYSWPGNVRELKNVIERAVILSQDEHLRLDLSFQTRSNEAEEPEDSAVKYPERGFLTEAEMKERQKQNILNALQYVDWRISGKNGAAALLGLRPSTLTDRMRAFNIKRPD
jgi:PAS domain S-box-containing protein